MDNSTKMNMDVFRFVYITTPLNCVDGLWRDLNWLGYHLSVFSQVKKKSSAVDQKVGQCRLFIQIATPVCDKILKPIFVASDFYLNNSPKGSYESGQLEY